MLLGDLLANFDDDAVAAETALRLSDLTTLNRMRESAEANGLTLGEYAQAAIRRFADGASDEDWVSLLGAMGRTEDLGAVCLQRAFAYATRTDNETTSSH
jgi:hypothetical protein